MLQQQTRADLFRLLGDEDRLRLFALCAEEELTVGELAEVLDDSQPQVSRKAQPLRAAGLLVARKDGTRTYLKAQAVDGDDGAIVQAALDEGRRLCRKDRLLARIPRVLRAREDTSRRFFDDDAGATPAPGAAVPAVLGFLPLLRPLLGDRTALCVDVGAGDGLLLPLLSPLFDRVFAVDRSAARLAACARLTGGLDLGNVRLLEGDADDVAVYEACFRHGGASVVVVARTLHHAARPGDLLAACARLLRADGVVVVVDYLPHDDEAMREQGDVWLGFPPERLGALAREAGLVPLASAPLPAPPSFPDSHLPWQWFAAAKGPPPHRGITAVQ
jgi:ArsR family transcriptional regulator